MMYFLAVLNYSSAIFYQFYQKDVDVSLTIICASIFLAAAYISEKIEGLKK